MRDKGIDRRSLLSAAVALGATAVIGSGARGQDEAARGAAVPKNHTLKVSKEVGGISLNIAGPAMARADTKQLTDCFNELLVCAERNNCFDKGLNAACLETIARHDEQCQCVSKAFGLAHAANPGARGAAVPKNHTLKVSREAGGISLNIAGPAMARADTKQLTDCFNELLVCAERNNCFDKGLNAACLATIARHDEQCQCVSKAFGLASPK